MTAGHRCGRSQRAAGYYETLLENLRSRLDRLSVVKLGPSIIVLLGVHPSIRPIASSQSLIDTQSKLDLLC